MSLHCVYKHTFPDGMVYVGQTLSGQERRRWNNGKGYKGQARLFSEIVRIGWDNIKHEILEDHISDDDIDDLEKYYIGLYDADNPDRGLNTYPCARPFNANKEEKHDYYDCTEMAYINLYVSTMHKGFPIVFEDLQEIPFLRTHINDDEVIRSLNALAPLYDPLTNRFPWQKQKYRRETK